MSIRRNATFNFVGAVAPLGVSLVTIPLFLRVIGEERYGVLAIVWSLLAYFTVFDAGISRAATNAIARLRSAPQAERQNVFWTAAALNVLVGTAGGFALYGFGAALARYAFKMPDAMRSEVLSAMPWLGVSIPLLTVSGTFAGALEACERFGTANAIQIAAGAVTPVTTLGVAFLHGPGLRWLILSALIARAAAIIPLVLAAARAVPLTGIAPPLRNWVKPLVTYGGWVSVNSLLDPLFGSADRFLIGAGIGAAAVTVYTVPYRVVHRIQIVPGALQRALFPRFSGLVDSEAGGLAVRAVRALAAGTAPLMAAAVVLLHPFLTLWISPQFAAEAAGVGEALALGTWMSGLALVPYSLLQAVGRPRAVALVHLAEAPLFAVAIWMGVHWGGVRGAAWVMCLRDVADTLVLAALAGLLPGVARRLTVAGAWVAAAIALTRLGQGAPGLTLALGGVLIAASTVWAFREEPVLVELMSRLLAKGLSALGARSAVAALRGTR